MPDTKKVDQTVDGRVFRNYMRSVSKHFYSACPENMVVLLTHQLEMIPVLMEI